MAASVPPAADYVPYNPTPTYGRNLLSSLDEALRKSPVICTQPEPWELCKDAFAPDTTPHLVTDVDHPAVLARCEKWKQEISDGTRAPVTCVFGIGGGSALDHAKYASVALKVPLVLCPSILSVDAGYTVAAGVREKREADGKVSVIYVGDSRPVALLVDFGMLQAAPPILNRSGIGDLLSCTHRM